MLKLENLRTVRQLSIECPVFTQAALRWAIFNAPHNGLSGAVLRIGAKVLIDRDEFLRWVASHRQGADSGPPPAAPARRQRRQ